MNFGENAGFFYGAGIMGVLAGLGLGSKGMNKWALLLGLGALWRANQLYPVVDIQARPELAESLPDLPSMPTAGDLRRRVGLNCYPGMGCYRR